MSEPMPESIPDYMTRSPTLLRASQPRSNSFDDPKANPALAAKSLDDAPYLAYCMITAMKHFIALACKRWPELK